MADAKPTTPPPAPPTVAPEPFLSDEFKAEIRSRLALADDAEVTEDTVLAALDTAASNPAVAEPDEPELVQRTIRHGLFGYDLPGGGQAIAFRGATVELLPHDVERGEKFDAFTDKVGDLPDPPASSTLPVLSEEASDAEADAWVESGTVQEILDAVHARHEILPAVLAAEQRRKDDARKTLLDALAKMNGSA